MVRRAACDPRFQVKLVAAPPACDLFARAGVAFERADVPAAPHASTPEARELLRAAGGIIAKHDPQALLVGLSGPDVGIDEALLACAKDAPTFALQDYWGDVNRTLGRLADLYFVVDEEAARLTRALHGAEALAVGAPKYAAYAEFDALAARACGRASLGVDPDVPVLGFFGQNLWRFAGYERTLRGFAAAARTMAPQALALYRPHPKEDVRAADGALAMLREHGLRACAERELSAEEAICACDVAVSVYSTACYDAAHLNRVSPSPLAAPLYLTFAPDLRDLIASHTGIAHLPAVVQGVCGEVSEAAELEPAIARALSGPCRSGFWRAARERLSAPDGAVDRILETVRQRALAAMRTRP